MKYAPLAHAFMSVDSPTVTIAGALDRIEENINHRTFRSLSVSKPLRVAARSLFNLGSYVGLYLIAVYFDTWWLWPVAWWFQAFILSGFLGAVHDCGHGTSWPSKRVSWAAGFFWSTPLLMNFPLYRAYHLEHHRRTGVSGDTEPTGRFTSLKSYLICASLLPFYQMFLRQIWKTFKGEFPHYMRSARSRRGTHFSTILICSWLLAMGLLTVWFPWVLASIYWIPLALYFPMVFWTSLPEHYGCDSGPDLAINTRSMNPNLLFRILYWNGNYHAEHHAVPWVSSEALPSLHKLIGGRFKYRNRSYFLFNAGVFWEACKKGWSS